MKFLKWGGIVIILLLAVYFAGPRPSKPVYTLDLPTLSRNVDSLENYFASRESALDIKPENEARFIWNDSSRQQTDYAVVYLHGFSASQEEGDPVHADFAKKFGCNLFLARLADHGIRSSEPLLEFTAERSWESAKEAYSAGLAIGKKVILLATSTGGTLALKLASEYDNIAGIILMSPNIAINDPNAWLLNDPWGLQIAHLVKGKYNTAKDTTARYARYWNNKYRMEATVQLQELIESTMTKTTFQKINEPVLMLYYYKDEEHQDQVVKVSAMKKMFGELGTADDQKRELSIPNAGDHVIGSYIKSGDVVAVQKACENFALEILGLKKQ